MAFALSSDENENYQAGLSYLLSLPLVLVFVGTPSSTKSCV
jgi:hypothetical protein